MMKWFKDLVFMTSMALHKDKAELLGPCVCSDPHCRLWCIKYKGRTVSVREFTYDRFRYAKEAS